MSTPKSIRTDLVTEMKTGRYAGCDHLPPEKDLAEQLGISRTQLRDVLASLEREGFITRRHGIGTVINHFVLAVQTRTDIEAEFLDMIRESGHTPGVAFVETCDELADETVARLLKIKEGSPVLSITRMCTADGFPAIYCKDIIDKGQIKVGYTQDDLKKPIFHFLEQFCSLSAYLDLTELRAVCADAHMAQVFQIPEGSPLLCMEEVDYSIDGQPVMCSIQHFANGIIHHTVMRKKL